MAKKKTTNKGINLLKGITGSALAKMATLVIILLAIPLTVIMSQRQQSTQQEASVVSGGGGRSQYLCGMQGGKCVNKSSCKGAVLTGYCKNWPKNVICCIPSGPKRCGYDYPKGVCQYDYLGLPCKGGYVSNLCPGKDTHYRCCKSRY